MPICESCGRDEREVTKVQRVYLVADDTPGGSNASPAEIEAATGPTSGDIEMWCASCCATFPHSVIETE